MTKTYGDRWETVESLPEGGQGFVYKVRDLKDANNQFAILKRLKDKNRLDRFKREIDALSLIDSEFILKVLDYNLEANKPYYVSEFCAGSSLDRATPFWHTEIDAKFNICIDVCKAVFKAHNNNPPIVHRDIKPGNIFLRKVKGPAVLGDFGICHFEDGQQITLVGDVMGPRDWTHPDLESGRSKEALPKHDIYSLGKLIYWIFSNSRILPRENHRDSDFDLSKKNEEIRNGVSPNYFEMLNRLLDGMLNIDGTRVPLIIDEVSGQLLQIKRLIDGKYNPIGKDMKYLCSFCGKGNLVPATSNYMDLLGYSPNEQFETSEEFLRKRWHLLVCSFCGYVEHFYIGHDQFADHPWNN